jgi:hypothetical protein
MWGTSSPEDKLVGDLGTAEKLAAGNLGLLQQNRHEV